MALKEDREGEDLISIGREFKTKGTAKLIARLPNSVRQLGMARMMAGGIERLRWQR